MEIIPEESEVTTKEDKICVRLRKAKEKDNWSLKKKTN